MVKQLLDKRALPEFRSKAEMMELLLHEEYGNLPPLPETLTFTETENFIPNFCAGKVISKKVEAHLTLLGKEFSFPFYVSLPKREQKVPFFVCINFRDCVPDRFMPTEEITDQGFAVLSFDYQDVTKDNADFTDGLAGILYPDGTRAPSDPGKIAMWAWAAHRVMDYAVMQDTLDLTRSIVCGHSRLGKTALLTAATDERFQFAYSNNSGCSGAALSRGKCGETVEIICQNFPYWFCENYKKYANREAEMPFDQHFLMASIAPRFVYVSSADEDSWADPTSEFLTCAAMDAVYQSFGKCGLVHQNRLPQTGDAFHEGSVGYHLRKGEHYLGREDWNQMIRFVEKHS